MLDYLVGIGSGNRLYFSVIPHSAHANQYDRVNFILSLLRERQMGIGLDYFVEYKAEMPTVPRQEPPSPKMPPIPWRRGPTKKRRPIIIPPVGDPAPDGLPRRPPRRPPRIPPEKPN